MVSPLRPTTAARLLLIATTVLCAVVMIGPFQSLERALVPWDKASHFIAAYGVTSLLFLSFPHRRRLDLAWITTFGGCGIELLQRLGGRDAELADMAANALGALAVVAPGYLEQARCALRATAGGHRPARRQRRRGRKLLLPAEAPSRTTV